MKKGFTLIEVIVSLAILVLLFLALYDLYIKGISIYKENKNQTNINIQVKNFTNSLYTYLKSSYQDSIKVIKNGEDLGIFMINTNKNSSVESNINEYIKEKKENDSFSIVENNLEKENTIDLNAVDEYLIFLKDKNNIKAITKSGENIILENAIKKFNISPVYSEDKLESISIEIVYFYKNKYDKVILNYTLRN